MLSVCKNKQSEINSVRPGVWECGSVTHSIHVNAIGVRPSVLEILLKSLPKWVGDLVETDKLSNPQHLSVVTCSAGVQPLDDGRHISKYASVH